MKVVLIALVVAVAARAQEEAATEYYANVSPGPVTTAAPDPYRGSYSEKVQPPMPYKFAWAVKDEPSRNDYSQQEESDGNVVTGLYRVLLPDGRTQVVAYTADKNGYRAQVTYEGEAQYPAYSSAYTPESYPESYPSSPSPLPVPSTSETYSTTQSYSSASESVA